MMNIRRVTKKEWIRLLFSDSKGRTPKKMEARTGRTYGRQNLDDAGFESSRACRAG